MLDFAQLPKPSIQLIPLKKLTLPESNPRTITKHAMNKLIASIEADPTFLFCRPVLAYESIDGLEVYAGSQRVRAAKKLGITAIPCIISSKLDENLIKQRIIKDNHHYGQDDFDSLANNYEIEDLLHAGFTEQELSLNIEVKDNQYQPSDDESEKEDKKKVKSCPNCGHEF
jgi:ParB-like chromosome segregation protein Spo0J